MRRRPPHLPFLAGPPDFTVGLRPIAPAAWLTPDWEAGSLGEKARLLAEHAAEVVQLAPGGAPLAAEAAALIADHLQLDPAADFPKVAAAISDDLAVMAADPAGGFRALAAALCAPTYFSAAEAIGKDLFGLHAPVPDKLADGAQGLGARIGRVFAGLRPGQVLERFNWTLQPGDARYTPSSAPLMVLADAAPEHGAADLLHLRVERQTIRKLPSESAVLFTIRVSLDPLTSVFAVPGAQAAFATAWYGAPAHVRAYKRWPRMDRLVRAALAD